VSDVRPDLSRRQGDYGIDGDFRVIPQRGHAVILALIGIVLVGLAVRSAVTGGATAAVAFGLLALAFVLFIGSYLRTSRVGKFEVRARVLGDLRLRGDEHVLDFGCGRRALLMTAARLLPTDGRSASTCGAPTRAATARTPPAAMGALASLDGHG
jgi:hypothetical protein